MGETSFNQGERKRTVGAFRGFRCAPQRFSQACSRALLHGHTLLLSALTAYPRWQNKQAYIAMCELGSLQSDWPVEPPRARTCTV